MPEAGVELTPQERLMTDGEIVDVARTFVDMGVSKIRLTGGEPMVRKGILDIVGAPLLAHSGVSASYERPRRPQADPAPGLAARQASLAG